MSNYRQFFEDLTSAHPAVSTDRKDTYGYIWETQACIWFLKNDPIWKTKFKLETIMSPQDWGYGIISSTTGNVVTQDIGINIVAEDHDGKLWGIQAKCYTNQIPTTEIKSFITALGITWTSVTDPGRTKEMDKGLLLVTDEISRTMRSKMLGNEKEIVTVGPGYFDSPESELDWFESINKAPKATYMVKTPYPHQAEALENIRNGWQDHDRGKCIMACGTGKTLVGLWAAEALQSKTTLVLLPSLSLVNQIATVWIKEAKIPISPLFVCSDKTVKKGIDSYIDNIEDLGFPVTTDENEIMSFFQNAPAEHRVIFSTYQSSESIEKAQKLGAPKFEVLIADEAHHCAGRVDTSFSRVLDGGKIRSDKRLFMTATPKYVSQREQKKKESEVASMDNEDQFGPYFHVLTFGEAIRRELLSDYQVVINVTTEQDAIETGTEFDARGIASFIEGIEKYNLSHIIAFHDRIKLSKEFVEDFNAVFSRVNENYENNPPSINHIDGKMTTKDRTEFLKRFRETDDGINILSNVRCLAEGVDVRAIDGIAFFAPKKSQIEIVQAVGRAIRKNKEGKSGTIFLQVMIPQKEINDPESAIQNSGFRGVWSVLQALRDHDALLGDQLDRLASKYGNRKTIDELPDRINVDLPAELDASFFSQFKTLLVMETTDRWHSNLGAFAAYKEENPGWHIPQGTKYGDFNVGNWNSSQRQAYDRGALSLERIQQLEEAGMSFNYSTSGGKFHTDEEVHDYDHVSWVDHQRDLYNKDTMTLERIRRLEEAGMILDTSELPKNA